MQPRFWRVLIFLPSVGCVSSTAYENVVKQAADARSALNHQLTRCEAAIEERELRVTALQRELDHATAENDGLRSELTRIGTDVDALLTERGTLASSLRESRARLEELRRAQAAADKRAQLYRDLAARFAQMVDAGSLQIALREGRMVLQLPDDILFDSGSDAIKPGGRATLREVATVLKTLENRRFHISGHTDTVPISTTRFPSNWELSLARGLRVLRVLVAEGVPSYALAAEGFGEFDPLVPNDSPEGRAKNRRTEIALQPQVDELVSLPEPDRVFTASHRADRSVSLCAR